MPVSCTKEELAKIRGGTCVSPSDMGAEVAQGEGGAAAGGGAVGVAGTALGSAAQRGWRFRSREKNLLTRFELTPVP